MYPLRKQVSLLYSFKIILCNTGSNVTLDETES